MNLSTEIEVNRGKEVKIVVIIIIINREEELKFLLEKMKNSTQ